MDTDSKRVLLRRLKKEYGYPRTQLNYDSPFQLLIAVMLSAQSTDKKVNEITPLLFREYPTPKRLAKAEVEDVEKIIREVNYHKTKSRHLVKTAGILEDTWQGELPVTHDTLLTLPGVGNKTANVILSELKIKEAFPVDTHVFRVSRRLGLAQATNRDKVQEELCNSFHKSRWYELHHWFIYHGRKVCVARTPKCDQCCLLDICPKKGLP